MPDLAAGCAGLARRLAVLLAQGVALATPAAALALLPSALTSPEGCVEGSTTHEALGREAALFPLHELDQGLQVHGVTVSVGQNIFLYFPIGEAPNELVHDDRVRVVDQLGAGRLGALDGVLGHCGQASDPAGKLPHRLAAVLLEGCQLDPVHRPVPLADSDGLELGQDSLLSDVGRRIRPREGSVVVTPQ